MATVLTMTINAPVSDKRVLTRERTFAIPVHSDFESVVEQITLVLEHLHREKVTGTWSINLSQGSVTNTKLIEKFTPK